MYENTLEYVELNTRTNLKGITLSDSIAELRTLPHPYVLVNFVDPQNDTLSDSQARHLTNFTEKTINHYWRGMNIRIINVDARIYKGEFEHYRENMPEAWKSDKETFSMLLYRPDAPKQGDKIKKLHVGGFRRMSMNLLTERQTAPKYKDAFTKNELQILHEMKRIAQSTCTFFYAHIIDCRKSGLDQKSEEMINHSLNQKQVLIRIQAGEDKGNEACLSILEGCARWTYNKNMPNITMVRLPTQSEEVEISTFVPGRCVENITDGEAIGICANQAYGEDIYSWLYDEYSPQELFGFSDL